MAQGSRQVQTQAQQQIQTLSPQQILVVKLLELPAVELEDRVRAELLENPALEEGKEDTPGDEYPDTPDTETGTEDGGDTSYDSLSDYLNEDDIPDYKLQENNRSKGEQAEEIPFSDATSFYETLRQPVSYTHLICLGQTIPVSCLNRATISLHLLWASSSYFLQMAQYAFQGLSLIHICCGLFSSTYGGGSLLEMELKRDVKLKKESSTPYTCRTEQSYLERSSSSRKRKP